MSNVETTIVFSVADSIDGFNRIWRQVGRKNVQQGIDAFVGKSNINKRVVFQGLQRERVDMGADETYFVAGKSASEALCGRHSP